MTLRINSNNVEIKAGSTANTAKVSNNNSIWTIDVNGEIEPTQQSELTGDCWLLTDINALSSTKWGKKMIKDAVRRDGNDVVITFKGAKKGPKEYKITAKEIFDAKKSGKYSSGDDDMIAFELAFEKYIKKYGKEHDDVTEDGLECGHGRTMEFITELLNGKKANCHYYIKDINNDKDADDFSKELDGIFSEIQNHPNEYAVTVSFKWDWMGMEKEHAYRVKGVETDKNGKKWVILINPWDSSKEEKVSYQTFKSNVKLMCVAENPNVKSNSNLQSSLEKEQILLEKKSNFIKTIDKILAELKKGIQNVDKEKLMQLMSKVDKDTVEYLLNVFRAFEASENGSGISAFVDIMDSIAFGWGNGKNKKQLIAPFVNAICDLAKEHGVDAKLIEDCKSACMKELDALLYTDEKVIIEKLEILWNAIDEKKNPLKNIMKQFGL